VIGAGPPATALAVAARAGRRDPCRAQGIATEAEVNIDTLVDLIAAETDGLWYVTNANIGAWAIKALPTSGSDGHA